MLAVVDFIAGNIARFFMMLFVLRFLMQLVRVPFQQPLGQFVLKMTNWLVLPLRRVLPGFGGYDLASLTASILLGLLLHLILYVANPLYALPALVYPSVWLLLLLFGFVETVVVSIYCLFGALLLQAVLSWTNPFHPLDATLRRLTDPLLRPLRRFIPPVANFDLTPLVLLLVLQFILYFPIAWLTLSLETLLKFGL